MQLYTDQYDFEKRFQHFLDIIRKIKTPEDELDKELIRNLEHQIHLTIVEFEPNSKAPGAILGIGKEPDVPVDTSKEELRRWGKAYTKNGLNTDFMYIFGEERFLDGWYLYVTGAKKLKTKLYLKPHIETYKFEVTREKKGIISSIGEMITCQTLPHHKQFVYGFFDIDEQRITDLERMSTLYRGGKI